jgi:queuine tRNA-ribosyltransferase
MQPDILFALPDIPYTLAPYSQKRLIKSTERTVRWLTSLLKYQFSQNLPPRSAIFAHLLGGSVLAARDAFTQSLLEPLEDKDSIDLPEIECVDQALSGYVLDLIPIRLSNIESPTSSTSAHILTPLLQASLEPLPASKPRLVTGVSSPHEILRCVAEVGIDIFDSGWAQKCADNGVALDFEFPVVRPRNMSAADARTRFAGAHNLYDERYAMDFGRLADNFSSAWEARSQAKSESASEGQRSLSVCTCMACSPLSPATTIQHSAFDVKMIENSTPTGDSSSEPGKTKFANEPPIPPFTRAYVHHLLHTHEMSAHTFLVSHNLAVLEAFFCGIRDVLAMSGSELGSESEITGTGGSLSSFGAEMVRFEAAYDENALCGPDGILHQGNRCWRIVEDLRGKGRFRREKEAEALGNTFPRAAPDADF